MKIFIADDSEIVRKRLRGIISEIEYLDLVGEASNADDAIQLLQNLEPDIVVLDIRMPGENGMAVLNELQKWEMPPTTIIYTSFATPQYRDIYQKAGAKYFFDKARDLDQFVELINNLTPITNPHPDQDQLESEKLPGAE